MIKQCAAFQVSRIRPTGICCCLPRQTQTKVHRAAYSYVLYNFFCGATKQCIDDKMVFKESQYNISVNK